MPSLVEIGPAVLERKSKIGKVYRRTDRRTDRQTTDERRSENLTRAFSSGELKKKQRNFLLFNQYAGRICFGGVGNTADRPFGVALGSK